MVVPLWRQNGQPLVASVIVIDGIVVAGIVVAGMMVVTIDNTPVLPSCVAGMALPIPLLVNGVGIVMADVSGGVWLFVPSYMLPFAPFAKV